MVKMARITIENAEVTRHLSDKGYIAEVRYRLRNGEEKIDKWTIWGKQPGLGEVINISGDLTIKTEEFEGSEGKVRYGRGHVNNPIVTSSALAAPAATPIDEGAPF
jgi:hypothetical protein